MLPHVAIALLLGVPVPATGATGYHHIGATTIDRYQGILGRMTVTDPGVRSGTYDFVATRFMARRDLGDRTEWLEAGWAETGWAGGGRQRVYTFDTRRKSWTFHDQYEVRPGNRIWIHLEVDREARAWLWWRDAWHLLAAVPLPLDGAAQLEQYVEVHVDPARGGTVAVPRITVDNVAVKEGGRLRYWRGGDVPTIAGNSTGIYCLDWEMPYDTWSAGDCTP